MYIIDANNLAGRIGILEEENFDKMLMGMVGDHFSNGNNDVFLIFDSSDPMGDKKEENGIKIIFAPKDGKNYFCADDKILEIVKNNLESPDFREEISVVTDDNELKQKILILAEETECQKRIHLLSCSEMVERINKSAEGVNDDFFEPRELDDRDQAEINEELSDIWG